MKIFALTPSADILLTKDLLAKLNTAGGVELVKEIKPFNKISGLFEGKEDRILAIDPDFCHWELPNEIINKIPNLKAIVLQTTGFDWVDGEFCKSKGTAVIDLPGYQKEAVSEWALMMALLVAHKAPIFIRDKWVLDYKKQQGIELNGKIAGVVGLGTIGTRMAEKLSGIGMKVQYWSRKTRDERFNYVDLEKLMTSSDLIVVSLAKNDETSKLITDRLLKSMKKTALLITIVDGVFNQDLVIRLVEEGKIYGYGFETGKAEFNNYKGNIWAGPALGWCTDENMKRTAEMWVEAIVRASKGDYTNRVN